MQTLPQYLKSRTLDLSSRPYVVVGAITALGAILRLYRLGSRPLWYDEAVLYGISSARTLSEMISQNASLNSAPPLFALLLGLVMRMGDSEWWLRFWPWMGGVAALPAVYFLTTRFAGRAAAYFSTLAVALASTQIEYSQQVREYSLTLLAAAIMLALSAQAMRHPTPRNFALLTLATVLGISLQYGLVLLVVSLNVVFILELGLARSHRRKLLLYWVGFQILVLFAAALVYFLSLKAQWSPGFGGSSYLAGKYGRGTFSSILHLAVFNTLDLLRFAFPGSFSFGLLAIGLLAGLVGAVKKRAASNGYMALSMLLLPILTAIAAASVRLYPYAGIRQDIFLLPMIYTFVGIGFGYLLAATKRRWLAAPIALLIVLGALAPTAEYLRSPGIENLRPVVSALDASFESGDTIYVYYGAQPAFAYYFRNHTDVQVVGTENRGQSRKYLVEIRSLLTSGNRLWLVFSHCHSDECTFIPERLSESYAVDLIASGAGSWLYLVQ